MMKFYVINDGGEAPIRYLAVAETTQVPNEIALESDYDHRLFEIGAAEIIDDLTHAIQAFETGLPIFSDKHGNTYTVSHAEVSWAKYLVVRE